MLNGTIYPANYYILNYNTLIGDSLLLTVRRTEYNNTFTFDFGARDFDSFSLDYQMKYENISNFISDGNKFIYNKVKTYNKVGGYNYFFNITEWAAGRQLPYESQINLIDDFTDYIIIEFFIDNLEYHYLSYVKLILTQSNGGFYYNNLYANIMKYSAAQNGLDILKLIAEGAFFVLLLYLIIDFILSTIEQIKSYDKWYKDKIIKLNLKTIELRSYLKPEIFRKLTYLIDVKKFTDINIIWLTIFLFYLRGKMLSYEIYFNQNYSSYGLMDFYSMRDEMYQHSDNREAYSMVGIIILLLCSLSLITSLNLGKYFSLLIRTLQDSKQNNFTFIVILLLIQPMFIFYGFLIFGEYNIDYSTLPLSIKSSINILFGSFSFVDYSNSANSLGPIFFFLYLFIINMILLNLFVAVIYASYVKVKDEIKHTSEIWSKRRVFLFCCYRPKKYIQLKKSLVDSEFEYHKTIHVKY
jgi:hypothetical protein